MNAAMMRKGYELSQSGSWSRSWSGSWSWLWSQLEALQTAGKG